MESTGGESTATAAAAAAGLEDQSGDHQEVKYNASGIKTIMLMLIKT